MTREEAIEALKYSIGVFPVTDRAVSALDMAVKALEQEPCEDTISRQAAVYIASGACHPSNIADELAKLPSVTPKPCEDAISRTWLKKAFHNYFQGLVHVVTEEDVQAYIDVAPTVTPKQRTGHWIFEKGDGKTCVDGYVCSACNKSFHTHVPYFAEYNYCPNCGCRMFEPQESEEQA